MSYEPLQEWQQRPNGPSGPRAGFLSRLGALVFDALLVGLPLLAIELGLGLGTLGRYGLSIVVTLLYYTFFEGSSAGQTPGKKFAGIRVIKQQASAARSDTAGPRGAISPASSARSRCSWGSSGCSGTASASAGTTRS